MLRRTGGRRALIDEPRIASHNCRTPPYLIFAGNVPMNDLPQQDPEVWAAIAAEIDTAAATAWR